MRNLVSIVMVLALVFTTTMAPAVSHAMPHDGAKAAHAESSKGHDCHHHDQANADSGKTTHNDKTDGGKCCDKGVCKCVGGNCHSLSKYFGNGSNSIVALSSSSTVFAFANQFVDSALPNRLKRPPKA